MKEKYRNRSVREIGRKLSSSLEAEVFPELVTEFTNFQLSFG